MDDIGRAAGMSRQSIYKKFGSKEACYEWTLNAYMAGAYREIFAILDESEGSAHDILARAFEVLGGASVDLLNMAHGAELLDDALAAAANAPENWPVAYEKRIGAFLQRHGFAASEERGLDLAHLLIAAKLGVMVDVKSRAEYTADMARIVRTVLGS